MKNQVAQGAISRGFVFFLVWILVAVVGCDSSDQDPEPLTANLSSIQARVFNGSCAISGCHTGDNPAEGLNLSNGQAFSNLVNVLSRQQTDLMRVAPGDPDASYLIRKLEGGPGILLTRMPQGRTPLPQSTIDVIREWIANGANND